VAYLYGSSAGTNTFVGYGNDAYLSGPGFTIGVHHNLNGPANYHFVDAYAGTSSDVAYFYGPSTGRNTFSLTRGGSYMDGSGYSNYAIGFHYAYAYAGTWADLVYIYADYWGSGGSASWGYGTGYFLYASGFGGSVYFRYPG
jgi:hypothetical protein